MLIIFFCFYKDLSLLGLVFFLFVDLSNLNAYIIYIEFFV